MIKNLPVTKVSVKKEAAPKSVKQPVKSHKLDYIVSRADARRKLAKKSTQ